MNERDKLAFVIFFSDVSDIDGCINDVGYYLDSWHKNFVPSLSEKHYGDCIKVPISCTRCLTEGYYKLADIILSALE